MNAIQTDKLLEEISCEAMKRCFIKEYQDGSRRVLDEALGIALSQYCEWDGLRLMEIFFSALEDSNFHTEAGKVYEWIEKIKGE